MGFWLNFIKTLQIMLKKIPPQPQLEMFKTVLTSFINPQHELCLLAKKFDWVILEKEFAPVYGILVCFPTLICQSWASLSIVNNFINMVQNCKITNYPQYLPAVDESHLKKQILTIMAEFLSFLKRFTNRIRWGWCFSAYSTKFSVWFIDGPSIHCHYGSYLASCFFQLVANKIMICFFHFCLFISSINQVITPF